jgi:hypothetical protein
MCSGSKCAALGGGITVKKTIVLLLLAAMAVSLLAGCGSESERQGYRSSGSFIAAAAGPEEDEDSPLDDPTVEEANAVNCISFAGLRQWYEATRDLPWAEREEAFKEKFNVEFRRYIDLAMLFEHVEPGTGNVKLVDFSAIRYGEFKDFVGWKAVWNTYYSPADGKFHQQKAVSAFKKAGYNIPANDRIVGIFKFDTDGDGKVDKIVYALLECFNILTERQVIQNVPKPVPNPTPTPTPSPPPDPSVEKYYSFQVDYVDSDNKVLHPTFSTKVRKGTSYDYTKETTLSISGYVIDKTSGDTAYASSRAADRDVKIVVRYRRGGGGGGGGSGGGGGGGTVTVYTVTVRYLHENGTQLASPYAENVYKGKTYDVSERVTKVITGYSWVRTDGDPKGTANGNVVITVWYKTTRDTTPGQYVPEWQEGLQPGTYPAQDGSGDKWEVPPENGVPKDEPGNDIPSVTPLPEEKSQPPLEGTEKIDGSWDNPV